MKLSVVIPAHNEAGSIVTTVEALATELASQAIPYEIVVVDDHSSDETAEIVAHLAEGNTAVRCIPNPGSMGFGYAVRAGLDAFTGDVVAIVMADLSDSPADIVTYYRLIADEGYDCAFGSRFMPGASCHDYPVVKLILNRLVNLAIRAAFRHGYNDTTNACKAYRRGVIEHVQPLLAGHFNLTVELPLKAVVRGFTYAVVPIAWTARRSGESKLRLQEMGSRYLLVILYVLLEARLGRRDPRGPAKGTEPSRLPPRRPQPDGLATSR